MTRHSISIKIRFISLLVLTRHLQGNSCWLVTRQRRSSHFLNRYASPAPRNIYKWCLREQLCTAERLNDLLDGQSPVLNMFFFQIYLSRRRSFHTNLRQLQSLQSIDCERHIIIRIDDLLDTLHGGRVLLSLELHSSIHQIRISEADVESPLLSLVRACLTAQLHMPNLFGHLALCPSSQYERHSDVL